MGSWATNAKTKAERCKEIENDCNWENENSKSQLLGKRVTTSGLWTLQKITDKDNSEYIHTIHIMNKNDGQWWVKSIYTGCGPCYYDCPKSLVKQWLKLKDNQFENEYETNWYHTWKAYDEKWEQAQSLKTGDVITCGNEKVKFLHWYTKNHNKLVGAREIDGKMFWYYTYGITSF